MQIMQTRRRFLAGAAMAGAAGIVGLPKSLHAEPQLDTITVRLPRAWRFLDELKRELKT